ncbi:MAG: hypothetical protein FGM30_05650 [Candidatus Fonsibacter sp.]|nr:hypothetical protein [Candidatus Fonsibacter sp.]
MDEKIRRKYLQLDEEQKSNFQLILEKLFSDKLKINEFKSLGISFSKKDWDYLDANFKQIFNSINFSELFELATRGIVPNKKENKNNLCSDSDINFWDEDQAEYYYSLPINYQKPNKLDIRLQLNLSLIDLIQSNKRKIKIKRKFEDEEHYTDFKFNLDKPYIVFANGGDMDDG